MAPIDRPAARKTPIWSLLSSDPLLFDLSGFEATQPEGSKAEARPDARCCYLVSPPHNVIDQLKAMRAPGESYGT
jgi:hypothetical protein